MFANKVAASGFALLLVTDSGVTAANGRLRTGGGGVLRIGWLTGNETGLETGTGSGCG